MALARSPSSDRGFSLIETIVSIGILTAVTVSVAQLFAMATAANMNAKGGTSTALLATQKMEQLRGLTWGLRGDNGVGFPVTDTTTNLATDPPRRNGRGLRPSPRASLLRNAPGYVDYLDADGRWVGTGAVPPAGTAFIRRWSILPLVSDPDNTLVLQVRVIPLHREVRRTRRSRGLRMSDETRLVSVKTRKTQ